MKCPVCTTPLRQVSHQGIVVDLCDQCQGVWFDHDEVIDLSKLLITAGKIPNAKIELDKKIINPAQLAEDTRTCPRCNTVMTKLNYAYDSNVIVDQCKTCNGIWTDAGEAVKLATFLKGNPCLDRLGSAMAGHYADQQQAKDSRERARNLARSQYFGYGPSIMLPLHDDTERHSFPGVVIGIMAINVVMLIVQILFFRGDQAPAFFQQMGLIPASAFDATGGGHGFLTSMFVHAGIFHLLGNMLFLWIFADNVEDRFGHLWFAVFYLLAGISGDLLHIAMHPNSMVPLVGASGAIAGAMGAYFILYPSANITTFIYGRMIDIPAVLYLGFWIVMQVISSHFDMSRGGGGGIAWFGHIGGFAFGAFVAAAIKYAVPAWRRRLKFEATTAIRR